MLHFFCDQGLRLPRRLYGGPGHGELVWAKPTYQAIHLVLSNPVYAGAYAYGRRREGGPPGLGPSGPRRRFALDALEVHFTPEPAGPAIGIEARVRTSARTGVEMEALVAVSAAGLALYDMCKSIDRAMTLGDVRLVRKSGGKSGLYERPGG